MLMNDSDGNKSLTSTLFVIGFIIVTTKLLFAGMTIGSFQMSSFSGVDFGAAVAALGGVYTLRRNSKTK